MSEVKVISSEPADLGQYMSRVWKYRSLILTFAKRDIKIRYAQTLLGVLWIFFQPVPSILIFTFFFSFLVKVDTGKLPYPVFALLGMCGWTYFTGLTNNIGNALIESQNILKKIYFPKTVLLLSKILSGAVDFSASFLLIIVALILFRVMPSWHIVFLPLFFVLNILVGLSVGTWISSLTFKHRDIQNIAPAVINFSIWLTPVFYPTTILPKQFNYLMYFNPMAFVIEGYRFCLTGENMPDKHYLISIIPMLFVLFSGLLYFRRVEDEISDYV